MKLLLAKAIGLSLLATAQVGIGQVAINPAGTVATPQAAVPALQSTPATQPARLADQILVLPFAPIGDASTLPASLATAVQNNLIADLAKSPLPPATADLPTGALADAIALAKSKASRFVLFGQYQSVDGMIRFSGQIVDAGSGAIVGGLSATGSVRDLFAIEDSLSLQARQAIQSLVAPPAPVPAPVVAARLPNNLYQGSDLQHYVDGNRPPSADYQNRDADSVRYNNRFYSSWNYWYPYTYYNWPGGSYAFNGYYSGYSYTPTYTPLRHHHHHDNPQSSIRFGFGNGEFN